VTALVRAYRVTIRVDEPGEPSESFGSAAPVCVNFALTFRAVPIVTTQIPVPEHAPDQLVNAAPAFGVAVIVTTVRTANAWVEVAPHEIPAGTLVTCPLPVPALTTVRSLVGTNVSRVTAPASATRLP
jgi:hypothetical protein